MGLELDERTSPTQKSPDPDLYARLLGSDGVGPPVSMHQAVRHARNKLSETACGGASWGAYQHYGDPYFRLLS